MFRDRKGKVLVGTNLVAPFLSHTLFLMIIITIIMIIEIFGKKLEKERRAKNMWRRFVSLGVTYIYMHRQTPTIKHMSRVLQNKRHHICSKFKS